MFSWRTRTRQLARVPIARPPSERFVNSAETLCEIVAVKRATLRIRLLVVVLHRLRDQKKKPKEKKKQRRKGKPSSCGMRAPLVCVQWRTRTREKTYANVYGPYSLFIQMNPLINLLNSNPPGYIHFNVPFFFFIYNIEASSWIN